MCPAPQFAAHIIIAKFQDIACNKAVSQPSSARFWLDMDLATLDQRLCKVEAAISASSNSASLDAGTLRLLLARLDALETALTEQRRAFAAFTDAITLQQKVGATASPASQATSVYNEATEGAAVSNSAAGSVATNGRAIPSTVDSATQTAAGRKPEEPVIPPPPLKKVTIKLPKGPSPLQPSNQADRTTTPSSAGGSPAGGRFNSLLAETPTTTQEAASPGIRPDFQGKGPIGAPVRGISSAVKAADGSTLRERRAAYAAKQSSGAQRSKGRSSTSLAIEAARRQAARSVQAAEQAKRQE